MGELEVRLRGKSLADYTNTQLRMALGAVLYTNTADMWNTYLKSLGYSGSVSAMLEKYYVDYAIPTQFRNYINAGAAINNPQNLFVDGSKGYIYDNNDLTSFYLDSAGTTAATVNGLVGLQLDKSQGLALGAELVTNGDFATDTVWTKGAGWTIAGGSLVATAVGSTVDTTQTINTVAGVAYEVTYTVSNYSAGGVVLLVGGGIGSIRSANGTYRELIFASVTGATTFRIRASSASNSYSIDNVSVKAFAGNHRYQTTTGSKPILRGTPVGGNIVTNGDFASGTGWTLQTGITISSGKLNFSSAPTTSAAQNVGEVVTGRVYIARFTISGYTAGGVSLANNDQGASIGTVYSANGTFEQYVTATQTGKIWVRARTGTTTLSVDDFTLFDVTADAVTAPYALQYDGVDDFLTTASVDFTATDKMAVVMGVRVGGTTAGVIQELSSNASTTNGSFALFSNNIGVSDVFFSIRNTASGDEYLYFSNGTNPSTSVLSASLDINNATKNSRIIGRKNGIVQGATYAGTGTVTGGNFGNHALFFGRRGGTTFPYNGLDFGGVCIGKALTATQLANIERWVNQRTGAY